MGMACGPDCPLHGEDVEIVVEKTKDGAVLKFSSKNAETVKAIQEHLTEHVATMKKMKEAAAKAPEAGACAELPDDEEVSPDRVRRERAFKAPRLLRRGAFFIDSAPAPC